MSRKHRPSKADRKPVTRRYVARVIQRATQDIVSAIVAASTLPPHNCQPMSHTFTVSYLPAFRLPATKEH
jgi:hypothetical protein